MVWVIWMHVPSNIQEGFKTTGFQRVQRSPPARNPAVAPCKESIAVTANNGSPVPAPSSHLSELKRRNQLNPRGAAVYNERHKPPTLDTRGGRPFFALFVCGSRPSLTPPHSFTTFRFLPPLIHTHIHIHAHTHSQCSVSCHSVLSEPSRPHLGGRSSLLLWLLLGPFATTPQSGPPCRSRCPCTPSSPTNSPLSSVNNPTSLLLCLFRHHYVVLLVDHD